MSCLGHMQVAKRLLRAAVATKAVGVPTGLNAAALLVERRAKQIVVEKGIVDTGNLLGSIGPVASPSGSVREITSHADYSIYNEMGTSKMAARPYMRPALDESQSAIETLLGGAVMKTIAASLGG